MGSATGVATSFSLAPRTSSIHEVPLPGDRLANGVGVGVGVGVDELVVDVDMDEPPVPLVGKRGLLG